MLWGPLFNLFHGMFLAQTLFHSGAPNWKKAAFSNVCLYGRDERLVACGAPVGPPEDSNASNVTRWFPSNVTELENWCWMVKKYVPCMIKWEFLCDGVKKYALGSILDACDSSSGTFHSGVRANIECIYSSWKNHRTWQTPCLAAGFNVSAEFKKYRKTGQMAANFPDKISNDYTNNIAAILWMFSELGCFLDHLECQTEEAKEVILGIHARHYAFLQPAVLQYKDVTLQVLDRLPVAQNRKGWIRDSVEMYKNKCESVHCDQYEGNLRSLYYA